MTSLAECDGFWQPPGGDNGGDLAHEYDPFRRGMRRGNRPGSSVRSISERRVCLNLVLFSNVWNEGFEMERAKRESGETG